MKNSRTLFNPMDVIENSIDLTRKRSGTRLGRQVGGCSDAGRIRSARPGPATEEDLLPFSFLHSSVDVFILAGQTVPTLVTFN